MVSREGSNVVESVWSKYLPKQLVLKVCEVNEKFYVAFWDFENEYDRVERENMWKILKIYDINGKLLNAVKRFHSGRKASV